MWIKLISIWLALKQRRNATRKSPIVRSLLRLCTSDTTYFHDNFSSFVENIKEPFRNWVSPRSFEWLPKRNRSYDLAPVVCGGTCTDLHRQAVSTTSRQIPWLYFDRLFWLEDNVHVQTKTFTSLHHCRRLYFNTWQKENLGFLEKLLPKPFSRRTGRNRLPVQIYSVCTIHWPNIAGGLCVRTH